MIARTENAGLIEQWAGDVAAGDGIVVEMDEVAVSLQYGSVRRVFQPGRHAVEDAGVAIVFVKITKQRGLRGGGALTCRDDRLDLVTHPRVMFEFNLRVTDPMRLVTAMAATLDNDAVVTWSKSVAKRAIERWVGSHGVMDAVSGAYDLAQEATPLAGEELEAVGLELELASVTLSLSDDDQRALREAIEARG